jgi:hypothetical protein
VNTINELREEIDTLKKLNRRLKWLIKSCLICLGHLVT